MLVTHAAPMDALMTRWTTITLHTLTPAILAVQDDTPRLILIAACTSVASTRPSLFRSQGLVWLQAEMENKKKPAIEMDRDVLRIGKFLLAAGGTATTSYTPYRNKNGKACDTQADADPILDRRAVLGQASR